MAAPYKPPRAETDDPAIRQTCRCARSPGEVPEWPIGTVSKTVVGASLPWVRIPPSPPDTPVTVKQGTSGRSESRESAWFSLHIMMRQPGTSGISQDRAASGTQASKPSARSTSKSTPWPVFAISRKKACRPSATASGAMCCSGKTPYFGLWDKGRLHAYPGGLIRRARSRAVRNSGATGSSIRHHADRKSTTFMFSAAPMCAKD